MVRKPSIVLTIFVIYFKILVVLFFFTMAQQPPVGQGLLIIEASRSHTHTTLGRTSLDEWSARRRQHTTLTRDKYPCPRRDSNL